MVDYVLWEIMSFSASLQRSIALGQELYVRIFHTRTFLVSTII